MKHPKKFILLFISLFLFSNLAIPQQDHSAHQKALTIVGIYEGYDSDIYSFKYTNEDKEEDEMFFSEISEEVLKAFSLKGDTLLGKRFEVSYTEQTETEIDDDGDTQETVTRTIVGLKELS